MIITRSLIPTDVIILSRDSPNEVVHAGRPKGEFGERRPAHGWSGEQLAFYALLFTQETRTNNVLLLIR